MATLEPGVVAFGQEDVESVEMVFRFGEELGFTEFGLPMNKDDCNEAERELRDMIWAVFTKVWAVYGHQAEMTYDPNDLVQA